MSSVSDKRRRAPVLIGVDTGGTFTDLVLWRDERLHHCKVLSTPHDPSEAIVQGMEKLNVKDRPVLMVHGTTVATNAVLEGKGAEVAYVTSQGFADVLALGRQQRTEIYALEQPAGPAPVAARHCFEISTRAAHDGSLLARASDDELAQLAASINALEVDAVAVNLLYAWLCPEEEQSLARMLPDSLFVSLASEVLPEIREYERGIATWLNASVGPVMSRYLRRLQKALPEAAISVLRSAGTTVAAAQAARHGVSLLLSGPAGGIAAARLLAEVTGRERMLTLDMGGTSTDVALLNGTIPLTQNSQIAGWPLTISSVDIHTIGAGGGSMARVDEGGMLLVGPESAGADPGPACYGRGGAAVTVTDANLVLGRLPADTLLGGYMPLDQPAAMAAMTRLGAQLGMDPIETAEGVLRVANEHMARALRVMSVERGHDPQDYDLVCFGGAGGLHACELAELMGMQRIVLPALAGVLSAHGMLASQPGRERVRAMLRTLPELDDPMLEREFHIQEQQSLEELGAEGIDAQRVTHRRKFELRYAGQSATLVLPAQELARMSEAFHCAHEAATGHRLARDIELVNLRVSSRAPAPLTRLERHQPLAAEKPQAAYVPQLQGTVPVFRRQALTPAQSVAGPALVLDEAATVWVAGGWLAALDDWGNLILTSRH